MSVETVQPWLSHRPRRGATRTDTIVLHSTSCDDVHDAIAGLKTRGLSYHYIIDTNGVAHKCVPYSAVAFHAGNSYGPHEAERGTSRQQDANGNYVEMTSVNEYSIGISFAYCSNFMDPFTNEQIDACVKLVTELRASVPSLKYITTHYWVSPGRANDPAGLDIIRLARKCGLDIWMA